MCERVFSALTNMKAKYRSRLNVESDLQVCLSQIAPSLDELCKVKQAHLSRRQINCICTSIIIIVSQVIKVMSCIIGVHKNQICKKGS